MQIITDPDNNRILTFDLFGHTFEFSRKYITIWHTMKVKEILFFEF